MTTSSIRIGWVMRDLHARDQVREDRTRGKAEDETRRSRRSEAGSTPYCCTLSKVSSAMTAVTMVGHDVRGALQHPDLRDVFSRGEVVLRIDAVPGDGALSRNG